jgi:hypothetical protein
MGSPGPSSSQYGSRYSMSRTCGPRDIIALVIPRLGDNRVHSTLFMWKSIFYKGRRGMMSYLIRRNMLELYHGLTAPYSVQACPCRPVFRYHRIKDAGENGPLAAVVRILGRPCNMSREPPSASTWHLPNAVSSIQAVPKSRRATTS